MRTLKTFCLSLTLSLLCSVFTAQAATITVDEAIDDNPAVDNGSCSLREAIQAANTNAAVDSCTAGDVDGTATDVIQFDAGTDVGGSGPITLSIAGTGEDLNATGDLDVRSNIDFQGNGQALTVIDGGDIDRVFDIGPGVTIDATFDSLMIQDGNSTGNGGCVLVEGTNDADFTDVRLTSCLANNGAGLYGIGTSLITLDASSRIDNNAATNNGGGIHFATGTGGVTLTGATIDINTAASNGGGIYNNGATLTVQSSALIDDNTATQLGGGVYNVTGTVIVTDSTVSNNTTNVSSGGGLYSATGSLSVTDSTVSGNSSNADGGGVFAIGTGTLTITRSTISGNNANVVGGGVNVVTNPTAMISNSTISGNSALAGGGINAFNSNTVTITNSTISGNTSGFEGSGITHNSAADMEIFNSTIALNTGGGQALTVNSGNVDVENSIFNNATDCGGAGTISSGRYNIESATACGFMAPGDQQNTDALLIALAVNVPGTTATHALPLGSPALDVGNTALTTDQRGFARPQGLGDDVGAYELDIAPILTENVPVPTPSGSTTPSWTFESTEAGTISYSGSCSSPTTAAVVGVNTVVFDALTPGTYSNCSVIVTDGTANASAPLAVTTFEITGAVDSGSSSGGGSSSGCAHLSCLPGTGQSSGEQSPTMEGESCAGYADVAANDPDCPAITYALSIGAMTGNDDGTFAPGQLLQRDQITKISLEAFGLFDPNEDYCDGEDPFPDVVSKDWSYQYTCRGKQLGMITGYESGEHAGMFVPANYVILVELWALILRNLDVVMPLGPSFNGWLVDAWYSGYARYVAMNDLYEGLPSATELVPRRDVAVFLYELHLLGVL